MNSHQFRYRMRQVFKSGSYKRLIKYRDESFLDDIGANDYTKDKDGSIRIYSGKVWFVHVPELTVEYNIMEID